MKRIILENIYRMRCEKGSFWQMVYQKMNKYKDISIRTKINNQRCTVPFGYSGEYYAHKWKFYDKQLGKICERIGGNKQISIIDVGANIGDTVLNIGNRKNLYLCVEGEKQYYTYIENNLKEYNYILEKVFCSDYEDDGKNKQTVMDHGTAKLVESYGGEVKVMTLDEIVEKNHFCPDIIKVDTDGYDYKVLRGAKKVLSETKPAIFFEWTKLEWSEAGEDLIGVFSYLKELGYEEVAIFDNFGYYIGIINCSNTAYLKQLIDYTKYQRIFYYDVLAVHKDAPYSINEVCSELHT